MKPIKIAIERNQNSPLETEEVKYTFKTLLTIAGIPWHFLPDTTDELVDIYYGQNLKPCKLFIEMLNLDKKDVALPIEAVTADENIFFVFTKNQPRKQIIIEDKQQFKIRNDIIFSTFYLLSGMQERFIKRDRHDIHKVQDSFLYQKKLLHRPLINEYSFIIKKIFEPTHNTLPAWPSNKKYAVALTHDIDYPEIVKSIEILRYMYKYKQKTKISKIFDIINSRENFWTFEKYVELEENYKMKSAFYLCSFCGSLPRYFLKTPDPFYNITKDKFKHIIKFLDQHNFEIGLHSSYLAYKSKDKFLREKQKLEQVLKKPVLGNRHHYWHLNQEDPSETALIHSEIGFLYDSSIMFDRHSGFRYGICSPFHLYENTKKQPVDVLQLPPTLMDNQLFGNLSLTVFTDYKDIIDLLLNNVKDVGGLFIANYHDYAFNETFYPNWSKSYKYLLKSIIKNNDYYCDIPVNIARYWLNREKQIYENSVDEY